MHTGPVWREWLSAAAKMAAAVACLRLGEWASRRSARSRGAMAGAGAVITVGAAAAHYPPLRELAGPWLILPGAEGALACLGALALLGIARADRKRAGRWPILVAATAAVFLLLISLAGGSLGWHYLGGRLRANYPDASGALQQTTGITCAPAAAPMLLHHAGIRVSEGELGSWPIPPRSRAPRRTPWPGPSIFSPGSGGCAPASSASTIGAPDAWLGHWSPS